MKEVMRPFAFRSSNGVAELADGIFARMAFRMVDNGKSRGTILVPPTYSTRVRGPFGVEDFGRGEVNVCMKLICCFDKGGDIGNVGSREQAKEFGPGVDEEVINHIS